MNKLFSGFVGVFLSLTVAVVAVVAQENAVRTVNGGVLNGKAVSLPKPEYPADAKNEGAEGSIAVNITIDEGGNVTSAKALPNYFGGKKTEAGDAPEAKPANPLLIEAAEKAAMGARFSPTLLSSQPVRVTGMIVYNFVASSSQDVKSPKTIDDGILNGKAISMPAPTYPPAARAVGASGTVSVEVTIDEQGNVISARAVSGHPLLQRAATEAARNATFSPTYLSGQPIKITGIVVYNFVAGTKPDDK